MAKGTGRTRGARGGADEAPKGEPEPAEPDEPTGKRLGIQLGPDGRIEWDRLRDRTRDELRVMLADPRIAAELGGAGAPVAVAGEVVPPATVGMLYGALGSLMVGAATAMGYPAEQAAGLHFTADERAQLLEPTSKVLSKYTGALGKWEDEILLAFAVGSILTPKIMSLKKPGQVLKMAERRPDPTPEPESAPDPSLM